MSANTALLSDLVTYLNRGVAPKYVETGGIRVYNQKCIRGQRVSDGPSRRTQASARLSQVDKELRLFDVLINSTGVGTLGRVGQIFGLDEPATADSHLTIVRPDPQKIDPLFLGYVLKAYEPEIERLGEGSTGQTELSRAKLGELEINLISRDAQKSASAFLYAIDKRLNLLRRISEDIDVFARTLFREWFGAGNSEDWPTARLDQHLTAHRGLSYKGAGLCESGEGVPMHNLNSVYEGGGYKYPGIKYYKGEFRERHVLKPGDIIVTNTEQGHEHRLIGFPAVVPSIFGDNGIFSQHIYRIVPLDSGYLGREFIYYLLMAGHVRDQIIGSTNGSTVNMLAISGLQDSTFSLPPQDIVEKFTATVRPFWEMAERNEKESSDLIKLRDLLLPMLIAGDLQLKGSVELLGVLP
jgi:type I restriction enzyme S subunit